MASVTEENIRFGEFYSPNFDLYLTDRDAPVPDEKEILIDVPFLQGEHDFSNLMGERVFKNRKNTYTFKAFKKSYDERKILENKLKDVLMSQNYSQIFDTHDADGFWWGKCSDVRVTDDAEYSKLQVIIEFTCYPFFYHRLNYFDDVWDNFNFDYDVSCYSAYNVTNSQKIIYINNGSTSTSPVVYASAKCKISINGESYELQVGNNRNYFMKLKRGVNDIVITGTARVVIFSRMEVMR